MAAETVREYDLSALGFVPASMTINQAGNYALGGENSESGVIEQDGLDDNEDPLPAGSYTAFLQVFADPAMTTQETAGVTIEA
jgi:hypothetical protein